MSGSSARARLAQRILQALDPAVVPETLRRFGRPPSVALPSSSQQLVLVGQRGAGKTTLLPLVGELLERPGVDLDEEIARIHGRALLDWVREDPVSFRSAERSTFQGLQPPAVVAAGGGFLFLHGELLLPHVAVLVPISFETCRSRLLQDTTRPRLRPELTLEEEIRSVFFEREAAHLESPAIHLGDFLRAAVDA
ncbi:MAG: shikimate kinase [Myxococcota bacterium]|nr:shikimate kinase [Myxococcota bacterium]